MWNSLKRSLWHTTKTHVETDGTLNLLPHLAQSYKIAQNYETETFTQSLKRMSVKGKDLSLISWNNICERIFVAEYFIVSRRIVGCDVFFSISYNEINSTSNEAT